MKLAGLLIDIVGSILNGLEDTDEVKEARAKYEEARAVYEKQVAAIGDVERSDRTRSDDELQSELGTIGIPTTGS